MKKFLTWNFSADQHFFWSLIQMFVWHKKFSFVKKNTFFMWWNTLFSIKKIKHQNLTLHKDIFYLLSLRPRVSFHPLNIWMTRTFIFNIYCWGDFLWDLNNNYKLLKISLHFWRIRKWQYVTLFPWHFGPKLTLM